MKLPNGDRAIVSDTKLYKYMLNPRHPEGGKHAYLFKLLLGITSDNAEELRAALIRAAGTLETAPGKASPFGQKFEILFTMNGARGTYNVLSVWFIGSDEDLPHLVTAYIR